MCEPQRSSGGGRAAAAIMVIGGLSVVAYLVDPTGVPAKPATPTPAPAAVHAGIPWWVYGLSALVLVVLAVAATLLVQRVSRRRPVQPVEQPVRRVQQRELTRGPQRELTTSAQAWLGAEKTRGN